MILQRLNDVFRDTSSNLYGYGAFCSENAIAEFLDSSKALTQSIDIFTPLIRDHYELRGK